jgi:hypothetical protein
MDFAILKIKVKENCANNILLSKHGNIINLDGAIWGKGEEKHPAAFIIDDKNPAQLQVTVKIPTAKPGVEYKLGCYCGIEGKFSLLFSGSAKAEDNSDEIVFVVTAQPGTGIENFFFILNEELTWYVNRNQNSEGADDAHLTYLEIYWNYAYDNILFRYGVPVEILRQIAYSCKIKRQLESRLCKGQKQENKSWLISVIVQSCFFRNPPSYDVREGNKHFTKGGADGNTLDLSGYLDALYHEEAVCNCADQAAVLQVFLRAAGITGVKYIYMEPFGYLRLTYLIGRGTCNNPKYMQPPGSDPPVTAERSKDRSYFNHHCFCIFPNSSPEQCNICSHNRDKKAENGTIGYNRSGCSVLDTCAGPHTGEENPENYVSSSVDDVFPEGGEHWTGTVKNIKCYKGVTEINRTIPIKKVDKEFYPHIHEFKKLFSIDGNSGKKMIGKKQEKFVICDWSFLNMPPVLNDNGFKLIYEKIIPGSDEVEKILKFRKKAEQIDIKFFVASKDTGHSLNRFLSMGSGSAHPELPYKKGPDYLGKQTAQYVSDNYSRYFWVFHNLVFDIVFYNVTFKEKKLLQWLKRSARCTYSLQKFTLKKLEESLPPTGGISIFSPQPQPDKPCKVTIKCGKKVWIKLEHHPHIIYDYIFSKGSGLLPFKRHTDECAEYLVFKGCKVSENKLEITAVDKNTLLPKRKVFTIHVIDE